MPEKSLNLSILLIASVCVIFCYPPMGLAQNDVTVTVEDGLGVRGSVCCSSNYPGSNRVELSLDNPNNDVKLFNADICSTDIGSKLLFSGYDVTPRADSFTYTITENSGCIEVRFPITSGVNIPQGSGPVAILYFDVSQTAVDGVCADLALSGVSVLDDIPGYYTLSHTDIDGQFCYYNCGSDQHCDDGLFCNGEEWCAGWCREALYPDPCDPLLCDEDNDRCYCDSNEQCDDGLYCNGAETCNVGTGNCAAGTRPCTDDGDPCTDDCYEPDSCLQVCNAAGPWDYCCQSSTTCMSAAVCNEQATLQIGDGSGQASSTGREVQISLANPSDEVRAVQVDICDVDDYLTIQSTCTKKPRVPTGFICECNEAANGCASCSVYPDFGVTAQIGTGSGPLFTVKYDVGGAPFGQCRDLAVDKENFLVMGGKVCSEGSQTPGAPCFFDADCLPNPGGTCVSDPLVTMPEDGEFCFPCTMDSACWVSGGCVDYDCNEGTGMCEYTNLTGSCNDFDPCTENDQCQKSDFGSNNVCVGTDSCGDDGDYCTGVDYCDGGTCYDTGDPCSPLTCSGDSCVGSDVSLIIEDAYGREGVINIALENSSDEVSEVHLNVCDADQRSWLHISTETCESAGRASAFGCTITDLGGGCAGVDITSPFPLDFIATGQGAIVELTYTTDPVDMHMDNYTDINPESGVVKDMAGISLSVTPKPGRLYAAADYCEGDFDHDIDVDAEDVTAFLTDFGRGTYYNPCTDLAPCNGDFGCDGDVDADDVAVLLEDFGRGLYNKPCLPYNPAFDCVY